MIHEVEGQGGEMLKLVVSSGRLREQHRVEFDRTALPILDVKNQISKLYKKRACKPKITPEMIEQKLLQM